MSTKIENKVQRWIDKARTRLGALPVGEVNAEILAELRRRCVRTSVGDESTVYFGSGWAIRASEKEI